MRGFVAALLVVLGASTVLAQFAQNPALQGKPKVDAAKAAEPAVPPAVGAANANEAGANNGVSNALFAALDVDGDGTISKIELRKAAASLKKLDNDNDGALSATECGAGAANAAGGAPIANANNGAQWLDQIMTKDKNKDGKLTADELTENERQMLQGADQNGDHAIDRQELAAMGQAAGNPNGNFGGVTNGAAAGRRGNEAMGRFFQADRNRDGKLTADEVPASSAGMMKAADLNGDGAVDAGEMQAFSTRMGNDRMRAWAAGVDPSNAANSNGAAAGANGSRRRPPRN